MISLERSLVALTTAVSFVRATYATKEDIANLRTEVARLEARMQRWFIGTAITLITLNAGMMFSMLKLLH
ncbi:MAG: hypothetical protein ACEQSK_00305 [Sphingomonadaceae bacterium]